MCTYLYFTTFLILIIQVTAGDIVNAEKLYGPVSHITTSQLPQSRLLSLVGEARYVKV